MTIRFYVTGGTFDKEYDELTGELFFKDTHIREMLLKGRCYLPLEIRTLMMLDSQQMTDIDREMITKCCAECDRERIVITHGTDSIVDTARFLAERIEDKVIVLVGAMIPFTFGSSDGQFNLGSALAFVQVLPPGVYIAMNGRYFDWNNVRKNRSVGLFEELAKGDQD
jgi:L-asparaginase